MKLAVGIDVHKEKCVAHVTYCGPNEPKPRQKGFLDRINEEFRRFPSDVRGMTDLARALKGHESHILIENSPSPTTYTGFSRVWAWMSSWPTPRI